MSTHFTEDPRIARQRTEEEEDDDPVTKAIKKTGCLKLHYDLQASLSSQVFTIDSIGMKLILIILFLIKGVYV